MLLLHPVASATHMGTDSFPGCSTSDPDGKPTEDGPKPGDPEDAPGSFSNKNKKSKMF